MAPFVGDDEAPWWSRLPATELAGWETGEAGSRDQDVPVELPTELLEQAQGEAARYAAGEWIWTSDPDCQCTHRCACGQDPTLRDRTAAGIPRSLAAVFQRQFRTEQRATAATWRAAEALHQLILTERGPLAAEHVAAELALRMGVHPRTGMNVLTLALRAVRDVARLVELMEAGCITDRHVTALLAEVGRWTDNDTQARLVLEQTLSRCEERADRYGWPTPGEMVRTLRRVALLHDLRAADKRRKSIAERRGVALWQSGAGAASLTIEGPDAQLALAYRAIAERAEAMRQLEGDTRSREQREYDAAVELLTLDADQPVGGGISARPTTGLQGEPVELVVRGAHIAVVMPYSVTRGGDLELAEIPGLGPILPSTARELLQHADSLTRVAVDATTGEVLAVDDAIAGPDRTRRRDAHRARTKASDSSRPEGHDEDDGDEGDGGGGGGRGPDSPAAPPPPSASTLDTSASGSRDTDLDDDLDDDLAQAGVPDSDNGPGTDSDNGPGTDSDTEPEGLSVSSAVAQLRELADSKVIWRDLGTSGYRVPGRLRRLIEHRDRTCCFPGCTVPGRYCDVDHREEWPRGGTHKNNCHVLCRRHHRAKQFYFADLTLDPTTGDTCWTTPDGTTYRRPPPRY